MNNPLQRKISLYFHPRLVEVFQDYDRERFDADLKTGFTAGVITLTLAIAFAISSGAMFTLDRLHSKLIKLGKQLILCGARTQSHLLMEQAGFFEKFEIGNIVGNLDQALERAREILPPSKPVQNIAELPQRF